MAVMGRGDRREVMGGGNQLYKVWMVPVLR